ncbi:prohead core protein [Rhizobium phage RHph_I46]|uniref:Prohead core protein n=1 Tax=Rhizobium phage RHph_I1_9 TaxID=2509729 RepID=A0A7S5RER5_9CAUD|nr:head scaffolding protein [Rhizobium phage RHph_I1_9]QIG69613.1 prohead core protein [Rhizobium phage RHph_I46]QIG70894.1 prohead core protein [Rhizobium phage RHph_I9]QIG73480.1 prohead core protein [Rhizobium phage RHph_I1_9]QIG76233.1 prohead core protein [Rhizobium phage RHph_I34]
MSKVGKVSSLLKFLEADEIEMDEKKEGEGDDAVNAGDGDAVEKVLEGEGDDAVNAGDGDSVERVLESDEDSEDDKKDETDAQTVDDDQVFVGETDDEDLLLLESDEDEDAEEKNEGEGDDAVNAGDGDSVERVLEDDSAEEEKLEALLLKFNMPASSFVEAKAILKELVESKALRLTKEAEEKIKKTYAESNSRKLKRLHEGVIAYARRSAKKFVEANEKQFVESAKFAQFESFIKQVNENFVEFGMKNDAKVVKKVEELNSQIVERNKEIDSLHSKLEVKEMKIEALKIASAISVLTEGMTKTDSDRFVRIVESLEVRDYKDFMKKAGSVKEKVFKESKNEKEEYDTFVESFSDKDRKNLGVVKENAEAANLVAAAAKILANG